MSSTANPTAPASPSGASRALVTRRQAQMLTNSLHISGGEMLRETAPVADSANVGGTPGFAATHDALPPISPVSTRPEAGWAGAPDEMTWRDPWASRRSTSTDEQDVDVDVTPKLGSGGAAPRAPRRGTPPQTPPRLVLRTQHDPKAARPDASLASCASSRSSSTGSSSQAVFSGLRMVSASPSTSSMSAESRQASAASFPGVELDPHAVVRIASSDGESLQTDDSPPLAQRPGAHAAMSPAHRWQNTDRQPLGEADPSRRAPTGPAPHDARSTWVARRIVNTPEKMSAALSAQAYRGPPLIPMPATPPSRRVGLRPDREPNRRPDNDVALATHAERDVRTGPATTADEGDAPLSLSRRASSVAAEHLPEGAAASRRASTASASGSSTSADHGQHASDPADAPTAEGAPSQGVAGQRTTSATPAAAQPPKKARLIGTRMRLTFGLLANRLDAKLTTYRRDAQSIKFVRSPASTRGTGPTQVRLAPTWRAPLCFPTASHAELLDDTLAADVGTALLKHGFWRGARAMNAVLTWSARQEMAAVLWALDALNEPREPGLLWPARSCLALVGSLVGCALLTLTGLVQLTRVAVGVCVGGTVGLVHQAFLLMLLPRDVLDGLQTDLPHVLLRTSSAMYAGQLEAHTYAALTEVARLGLSQDVQTGRYTVGQQMQDHPQIVRLLGELRRYRELMVAAEDDADQLRRYMLAGQQPRLNALNLAEGAMPLPLAGGAQAADDLWPERGFRALPQLCRRAQHDPQRVAQAENDALEHYRTRIFQAHPELCAALGLPNLAAFEEQPGVREHTAVLSRLDPLQLLQTACDNVRKEDGSREALLEELPKTLRRCVHDEASASRPMS